MDKKKTILVIEDDPYINRILEVHLTSIGFDVLKAFDGEDGIAKAKEQKPDLIILDLGLPRISGEALCRELKLDDRYKHIPVIMLTAKDTDTDRVVGRVIGADVYMTKPYEIDLLEKEVKTLLGLCAEPEK